MSNLEDLLKEQADIQFNLLQKNRTTEQASEPHKADKSASLEDFIGMVAKLCKKVLKKHQVVFQPDEGVHMKLDPNEELLNPYIYYEIIERKPVLEIKPREREQINERHDDIHQIRSGKILGQKFVSLVQFNFLACDYRSVNSVMYEFERLIFDYTFSFKQNGVAEILFVKQHTDKNLQVFRQSLSVRSLQYKVYTERLFSVFETEIAEVNVI